MKKSIIIAMAALCLLGLRARAGDAKISAGDNHTLLLTPDGLVMATGWNLYGQLGIGNTTNQSNYVSISGLSNVTAISAGGDFSLAISNGYVYSWGRGANGRLGNGYTTNASTPVLVRSVGGDPLTNIIAISAGEEFALALQQTTETNCPWEECEPEELQINVLINRVWSWGRNNEGQLGIGNYTSQSNAVVVQSDFGDLTGISIIAAGYDHAVAFEPDFAALYTWGSAPGNGEQTSWTGNANLHTATMTVWWAYPPAEIAAGNGYTLYRTDFGEVWGWGAQAEGELGDGTVTTRFLNGESNGEVRAGTLTNIVSISARRGHSLALEDNGKVWSWGYNLFARLGDGTQVERHSPVLALLTGSSGGQSNIVAISAGQEHSVALATNSSLGGWDVVGWGHHHVGQIGNSQFDWRNHFALTDISTVSNHIGSASVGGSSVHVLLANQTVASWGANGNGQSGSGTITNELWPVSAVHTNGLNLTNITAIESGWNFVLAISNGYIWSWGDGEYGKLCIGSAPLYKANPVLVTNAEMTNIVAVSGGGDHGLALRGTDGTVWSWGSGNNGHLGIGRQTNINGTNITYSYPHKSTPQQVTNTTGTALAGFSLISAGRSHSLAVDTNGYVWSWGYNASGALGQGNFLIQSNAVQITNFTGGAAVTAISGGDLFSLCISNEVIYGWGENASGQLGVGNTSDKTTPTQVTNVTGFLAVAAGYDHSIGLRTNGTVWVWGANTRGQLGLGDTASRNVPTQVTSLSNIVSIAAGEFHSIAVKSDGTVYVAGDTVSGQHGNGNVGYKRWLTPATDPY